jgi:aminoglycoside 3-N-acetyltransferase
MGEFNLITKEVIFDSFQKVIKKKDKVVLLYSGLWSLINKLEFKKNIGKNFLNILEEIVGKKKTLVLPSFSGTSFIKNKVFNIRKSLDNKNGLLSKEALHRSYYYRTPQPIHSYLVFGDGKKEIDSLKFETSWGKTSILEWLSKKNSRICVLGIPWNKGCSYLHRFEELYNVPWRYFKDFKGKMINHNGEISDCFERKYSSPNSNILQYDFQPMINHMKKDNIFISNNEHFFLESTTAKQIDKSASDFFKKKLQWKIVKNKRAIINWISKEKTYEMNKNL